MEDFWLYGVFATALATPPDHLQGRVESLLGGGNYTAAVLPVVVGEQQCAQLGFCHITGSRLGDERWLSAPFATLSAAYPSKQTTWRDTKAVDFGLLATLRKDDDPTEYVGEVDRQGMTMAELREASSQYPRLVSRVLEHRWLITRYPPTEEERATAQQLQQYVRVLYDKPLLPYYQHAGHHFLAWIARTA